MMAEEEEEENNEDQIIIDQDAEADHLRDHSFQRQSGVAGGVHKQKNIGCRHKDRSHYAKQMCKSCYLRSGRTKRAWKCAHPDRSHYAKGYCQSCYMAVSYV